MQAIKSKKIITPQKIVDGYLVFENSKIIDVVAADNFNSNITIIDVGENIVMPGLIDCHVHINEPGRTNWEGFETATMAAAASGITTLIEMPLNASPVTTNVNNFDIKLAATKGKLHVNCGFWGGVIPSNLNDLEPLLNAGTFGLKAFLTHSGIDEFPNVTEENLLYAANILAKHNKPLLVHCELDELNTEAQNLLLQNPTSYKAYLASRPKSWENKAVELMINICRKTNCHVHIVHVSSAEALPLIEAAKKEGLKVTAETCQHYLFFDAENITDGDTSLKCAPPIREAANNILLWQALKNGVLDFVVTDHSPAPPELKEIESGNFAKAWGGIATLQFALSAFWTKASQKGFSVSDVAKLMSENVAKFIGLNNTKGKLEKGFDADFFIWDSNSKFIVEEKNILHKHKVTPYKNLELSGKVLSTYVNGNLVYEHNKFNSLNNGFVLRKK